jgi:hypothetical protein
MFNKKLKQINRIITYWNVKGFVKSMKERMIETAFRQVVTETSNQQDNT